MFRYYVQYYYVDTYILRRRKKRGQGKVELLSETRRGKRTGERTKFDHMAKKGGMIVSSPLWILRVVAPVDPM